MFEAFVPQVGRKDSAEEITVVACTVAAEMSKPCLNVCPLWKRCTMLSKGSHREDAWRRVKYQRREWSGNALESL